MNSDTIDQILSLNAKKAMRAIKGLTDLEMLQSIIDTECIHGGRSTVIGAAQMRLDSLTEDSIVVVLDEQDEPEADELEPVDEEPAEFVPEVEPIEEPVIEAEPVTAEPTIERTPAENCAVAFYAALRSRDISLVTLLISELRADDSDDETMARALVEHQPTAQAQSKRSRTPSQRGPSPSRANLDMSKADGMVFGFKRKGFTGQATIDSDGTIKVLAGARVNPVDIDGSKRLASIKETMLSAGTMVIDGDMCVTTEDVSFASPCPAGAFMCGKASGGYRAWRTEDGRTAIQVCAVSR